jgi:hypothetical protein
MSLGYVKGAPYACDMPRMKCIGAYATQVVDMVVCTYDALVDSLRAVTLVCKRGAKRDKTLIQMQLEVAVILHV